MSDPSWMGLARTLLGTAEYSGSASNPTIIRWAQRSGLGGSYTTDSIPWCGLFANYVMRTSGYRPPSGPLRARNWLNFGRPLTRPSPGAIMVYRRGTGGQGHVCFYVSESSTHHHVLGGNQGDRVSISTQRKSGLLGIRWPDGEPNPNLAEVFREEAFEAGPDNEVFEHNLIQRSPGIPSGAVTGVNVYTNFETGEVVYQAGDPNAGAGKKIARVGDPCTHGAIIITGASHRFVGGQAVARIDDLVNCPTHGQNKIVTGSSTILVEGKGVAYVGSVTECGAEILDGDSTVFTAP